ncbi:hypothetical protein [Tomitella biformata]|uniref:hypothetical protein n=1 Tax=Tomitella biformata TaxID=630403 RepID=UPI0004636F2E|nr:hypothetical protein [Tomitella biformata]
MDTVESYTATTWSDPIGGTAIKVAAVCALDEPTEFDTAPTLREIADGAVLTATFIDHLVPVDSWPIPDRAFVDALNESVADFATVAPVVAVRVKGPGGSEGHLCLWIEMRPRDPQQLPLWSLYCECRDDQCLYINAARLLRSGVKHVAADKDPQVLRDLLDRDRAGEWLGQPGGFPMWGSTMYLQTVSRLTGWTMHECWAVADHAVKAGVISMEGAVVGYPITVRDVPSGPIMNWDTNEPTDPDGWVVWWSRFDGRYQVEVTRLNNADANSGQLTVYAGRTGEVLHSEPVGIAYGAPFGPDVSDVDLWRCLAMAAVDEQTEKDSGGRNG